MGDVGPSMDEPAAGASPSGNHPAGYRLPAETRLGAVTLQVADLDRSVAYYRDLLGMRPRRDESGAVALTTLDGTVLVELRELRGAAPVPRRGRLGLYHFALLLPDRASLGAFLGHIAEQGVRPGMADHSVSEALYLTDPDGLGIEVYADRPRSTWSYRGRELHMTTDPLDVPGVLREANGPWGGMPAGSGMGHVHLFVGELEQASSFYHHGVGFDRTVWSYPGALFMAAGGYHHHLGTNIWAADAPLAGPEDARLLEWVVVLPNAGEVEAAAASVEEAGHAVQRDDRGWTAADPWDTRVRVISDDAQ